MGATILGSVCGGFATEALITAAEATQSALEGEGYVAILMADGPAHPVVTALVASGISVAPARSLGVRVGDDPWPFSWEPDHPTPEDRQRAMSWALHPERLGGEDLSLLRTHFAPHGVRDRARKLVYEDRTFLAMISVERSAARARFTEADLGWMDATTRLWRRDLLAAKSAEGKLLGERTMMLFEPGGACRTMSPAAARWATEHRVETIAEAVRAFDEGRGAAICVLDGSEVRIVGVESNAERRYLVTLRPPLPAVAKPSADLSATQRGIARRAAEGQAVDRIADELGLSEQEVRDALAVVFDTLGVFTRAALLHALEQRRRPA